MTRRALRFTHLEDRVAPALATWDGGGADNHWTTAANWAGDVAPQPGDDLVFPSGVAQLANVNDFAAGKCFGFQSTRTAVPAPLCRSRRPSHWFGSTGYALSVRGH